MRSLLIDHIGIIVEDIDKSLPFYRDILGLDFQGIERMETYNLDIAFLQCGETLVELLAPTGEGTYQEILNTKGEGIDHIAFRVGDVAAGLAEMKEKGVPLVDESPKVGGGGAKIRFFACGGREQCVH